MRTDWKSCLRIGVTVILIILCVMLMPKAGNFLLSVLSAASPLFIGCIIAYLINILMNMYEKRYFPRAQNKALIKSRRPVCMFLAIITIIAVVVFVMALVLPQLIEGVTLFIIKIPDFIKTVINQVENWDFLPEETMDYLKSFDWKSKIGSILEIITSGFGNVINFLIGTISSVFSGAVTALIAAIFATYVLLEKERIAGQYHKLMKRYVKPQITEKIDHVLSVMNDCFSKYIIGQCIEAVILGGLCYLGMILFRFPYATMIGALIALTALIPIAGAYIGGGIGAFMIFTVSPLESLFFIVFIVVLQQLEGNLIFPRVVGSSIGLPGIWVLAAVTIGGGVMGILGMLLGVPLAATAYRLLGEAVNRGSDNTNT